MDKNINITSDSKKCQNNTQLKMHTATGNINTREKWAELCCGRRMLNECFMMATLNFLVRFRIMLR